MTLLFLGTGGSMGTPVIGCDCSVCRSTSPFNKRSRPSVLLSLNGKNFLIDAGPDFRNQALRFGIRSIDGLIITHAHYDHVGGFDDLRALFKEIPCLMSEATHNDLKKLFYYIFDKSVPDNKLVSRLAVHLLPDARGELIFEGLPLRYFTYSQAGMPVTGFRFGDLAYVSDIRDYQESLFEDLSGVKTLVLSALRHTRSHLHFNIDEAVAFAKKVGATQTFLTHISHELDHETTKLPPGIALAYDGLTIK